jgi:hypothetical protein
MVIFDDSHIDNIYFLGVSGPLAVKDWYYGMIKRHECDDMLNLYGVDGDFVIRDSETNVGDYSVSLKAPGQ